MLIFAFFTILCVSSIRAQDGLPVANKTQCIEQFVQWCDSMDYRSVGVSVVSYVYQDTASGYNNRVFCSTDKEGTNCTRNGSPWFECPPDHSLTYKGRPLQSDTPAADVDEDICGSAERAFGDLMLQNFAFDNETLREYQNQMDSFFREMLNLQQQMRELQERLTADFSTGGDFWQGFGNIFGGGGDASPADGDASTDTASNASDNGSQDNDADSNQIEKE